MTAINRFTALPSAARTTSGSADLAAFPQDFDELILYVDVTAASGTTPTLAITYQISPDNVNWFDHTTGTTLTAAGKQVIRLPNTTAGFGRVSYAIGGTTPSFTFSVVAEGKRLGN